MHRSVALSAVLLSFSLLAAAARASDEAAAHRAQLLMGPLVGGQPLVVDLRTTEPFAPVAFFVGFDGTPIAPGGLFVPAFSMNVGAAQAIVLATNGQGRVLSVTPTTPGVFGPSGTGLVLWSQAYLQTQTGLRIVSNRQAVEVEPTAVPSNFLVDDAAARLPAVSADMEGFSAEAADLDKDGDPDLAITAIDNATGEMFAAIWRNDGDGLFADVTTSALPGFPQGDPVGLVRAFDANGDNRLDLLITGGNDFSLDVPDTLWLQGPGGVFTQDSGFPAGNGLTGVVELGDFDGNGWVDAAAVVGPSGHAPGVFEPVQLLLNDSNSWMPDSAFANAVWNDPSASNTSVTTGDVDNDGDLDLFLTRLGTPNRLLENNGLGQFSDTTAARVPWNPSDNSLDAAFADFNLDGWLDLAVANSHFSIGPASSGDLYLNDGAGVLVENASSSFEQFFTSDGFRLTVDAGDLDGDGDVDLYVGTHDLFAGANHQVFLNQGGAQAGVTGTLTRQSWFDPDDFISAGVELFDMDADGDTDLLQIAAGVVSGDPSQGFRTRLFENSNL